MLKIGSALRASPGDRLVVQGHRVGDPTRDAEVLEALGEDGSPPFLVRWEDDGHVSRLYPSSDAHVHHFVSRSAEPAPVDSEPPSLSAEWEAALPPMDS